MLISMWALASDRFLRRGVRPEQLGEEELINFWADDLKPSFGRHAFQPDQPTAHDLAPRFGATLAVTGAAGA